jgi:predicted transcriptional regulator
MPDSLDLQCSDDLLQSLIEASNCSFILLALRRQDQPLELSTIASLLSINNRHTSRLLDMLIRFGFVLPVENGFSFTITASGIDLLSPQPVRQPWDFDPTLKVDGDRLPSYIAFDLLPLRIYSYRRSALSSRDDQDLDK